MFGQRLRLARKRAGLSLRALAERMEPKVTAQAISKYEAGRMMPSSAVLVGLGEALNVSLDFLMSDRIDVLDGLVFRRDPGTSRRERARAEALLIDNLERYLTIEEILGIPPAGDRFEHCRCDCIASEAEIDERANRLREEWDLGMDAVPSLCALLEEKGIKVVEADLPERISGLACRAMRRGTVVADAVVVSSRTNVERKRFTLAHELAHKIIRATGNPAIKLEAAMSRFAGRSSCRGGICWRRSERGVGGSRTTRSRGSSTRMGCLRRPSSCGWGRWGCCVHLRCGERSRHLPAAG